MIPTALTPLANHLWQSTLFAAMAALLAVSMRDTRASIRYCLWLTASLKYLAPFSWLIDLGRQWHWRSPAAAAPVPLVPWIGDIGQPFAPPASTSPMPATQGPELILTVASIVWVCGCVLAAWGWLRSWMQLRAAVRDGAARVAGLPIWPTSMRVVESRALLEPCVFGILRPVLLLPAGIRERLTPQQLRAILLHELCHLRRHDNLWAALHMAVEVLFWFWPPVYWIGKRLMYEREIACDEAVLCVASPADVYAQGILEVCRFGLQSAPLCASGVAGSNLKGRIARIMQYQGAAKLGFRRKLLLASAAAAALAGPIALGLVEAAPRAQADPQFDAAARPSFEVASVRAYKDEGPRNAHSYGPQGVTFGGCSLAFIVGEAYHFPVGRIVGPDSLTPESIWKSLTQGYDIVAKADRPVSKDQLRLMLQSLLAERFQLKVRREFKTAPVYKLVIAKGGPKLEESTGDLVMSGSGVGQVFRNAEMIRLAGYLSNFLDRMVVDETGLKGYYNFTVKTPEELRQEPRVKQLAPNAESPNAAIFADALKPLGLQLIAATAPVEYLVVDRVEKPSEN